MEPSPVEGEGDKANGRTSPIIIRSLAQALAALDAAAGEPISLISPPATPTSWGIDWFAALIDRVRAARPGARFETILDCGDSAGHAALALGRGFDAIVFTGGPAVRARLADLAERSGVRLIGQPVRLPSPGPSATSPASSQSPSVVEDQPCEPPSA